MSIICNRNLHRGSFSYSSGCSLSWVTPRSKREIAYSIRSRSSYRQLLTTDDSSYFRISKSALSSPISSPFSLFFLSFLIHPFPRSISDKFSHITWILNWVKMGPNALLNHVEYCLQIPMKLNSHLFISWQIA